MAMSDCVEICGVTGCDVARMNEMEVYMTAGKIIHDPVVTERKLKLANNGIVATGTSAAVIKAMSKQERALLWERVTGVVQIQKPSHG
jgi:hypothetical protein